MDEGALSSTCKCGVARSVEVRAGSQGRWCLNCWRMWLYRIPIDWSAVAMLERTSCTAIEPAVIGSPGLPLCVALTPGWTPAVSYEEERYVAGSREWRLL